MAIILFIWLAPAAINIVKAIGTGDFQGVLKESGGRLFAIDNSIKDETDILLDETKPQYELVFHLSYVMTLMFMLFFLGYFLYRFGNWLAGQHQFSPIIDVILIIVIILFFALIEFFYCYLVLDKTIMPLKDGIYYFIKNLPGIFTNLLN